MDVNHIRLTTHLLKPNLFKNKNLEGVRWRPQILHQLKSFRRWIPFSCFLSNDQSNGEKKLQMMKFEDSPIYL